MLIDCPAAGLRFSNDLHNKTRSARWSIPCQKEAILWNEITFGIDFATHWLPTGQWLNVKARSRLSPVPPCEVFALPFSSERATQTSRRMYIHQHTPSRSADITYPWASSLHGSLTRIESCEVSQSQKPSVNNAFEIMLWPQPLPAMTYVTHPFSDMFAETFQHTIGNGVRSFFALVCKI